MLPRFTAANAEELEKALADSAKVQDGDPFASTTWFQRMARVRDGVARLNASLNYSEALNTGEKLKLNDRATSLRRRRPLGRLAAQSRQEPAGRKTFPGRAVGARRLTCASRWPGC